MTDAVVEFLRTRGLVEEKLDSIIENKIDPETVECIDDPTLAKYVPKLGDRAALRKFCASHKQSQSKSAKSAKRTNLFELLKAKLHKTEPEPSECNSLTDAEVLDLKVKQKPSRKLTRKVEIGWIHNKAQVRKRKGGGIRKVDVPRSARKEDLLSIAKDLFFPNVVGDISQFKTDILDFKETPMPDDISVADCYELFRTGILTFYLHTSRLVNSSSSSSSEEDLVMVSNVNRRHVASSRDSEMLPVMTVHNMKAASTYRQHDLSNDVLLAHVGRALVENSTFMDLGTPTVQLNTTRCCTAVAAASSEVESTVDNTLPIVTELLGTPGSLNTTAHCQVLSTPMHSEKKLLIEPASAWHSDHNYSQTDKSGHESELPDVMQTKNSASCSGTSWMPPAPTGTPTALNRSATCTVVTDPRLNLQEQEQRTIERSFIADRLSCTQDPQQSPTSKSIQNIVLHRGNVFNELIEFLLCHKPDVHNVHITVEMVLPNGNMEAAEDTGGVFRDVLTEFWDTFYNGYTTGNCAKVPALVHTMSAEKWKAVAGVIAIGYAQEYYFPIGLALPFVITCIGGISGSVNTNDLIQSFLMYLPDTDREVIEKAMQDFDAVATDELIETLDTYSVRVTPTVNNIRHVIEQIAHRELIQAPAFISECWQEVIGGIRPALDIHQIYRKLTPNVRKVLSLVDVEQGSDLTSSEKTTLDFLRKYIRTLSQDMLKQFLRFVTGSDLVVVDRILVQFVECNNSFARTPVAHTCGCVLELATTYEDFVQFRQEFNLVLQSRIWVMDII